MTSINLDKSPLLSEYSSKSSVSPKTVEMAVVLVASSRLPSSKAIPPPSSLEKGRAIKCPNPEVARDGFVVICVPLFGCALCIGLIVWLVRLSLPGEIIHPNECDQLQELNQALVSNSTAFMEHSFENLLAQHNVTVPVQPIINSFTNAFGNAFATTTKIYFGSCSETSKWWNCAKMFQFFMEGLTSAKPLISQSLGIVTEMGNITLSPMVKSQLVASQVDNLCNIAIAHARGCPIENLCDFIPK